MADSISSVLKDSGNLSLMKEGAEKRKVLLDELESRIGDGATLRYAFPGSDSDRVFISQILNGLKDRGYELGGGTTEERDGEGNTVEVFRKSRSDKARGKEIDFDRVVAGWMGRMDSSVKLRTGEFSTEKSIKSGRSRLCIVASDASEATKKRFSDMCAYRKVPFMICESDKEELGHTAGRQMRASASVEDAGLARNIADLIEGGNVNEQ